MPKTIISLPVGDFVVHRRVYPHGCEGCWFFENNVPCIQDFPKCATPCREYIDSTHVAVLVPNFVLA